MIHKTVLLPCLPDRAFSLFTERIDEWWPKERRHIQHAESTILLAPKRFFERGPDGTEVELGRVRAWEPPVRVMFDWYPGTGPEQPTEVEVRFVEVGASTRVEVRHGPGAAGFDLFSRRAPKYEASWDLVLDALDQASRR